MKSNPAASAPARSITSCESQEDILSMLIEGGDMLIEGGDMEMV